MALRLVFVFALLVVAVTTVQAQYQCISHDGTPVDWFVGKSLS
jgi:hypothetical protein